MRGYDVVTSDDRVVGTGRRRAGRLPDRGVGPVRKSRHPVPREFVHAVDGAAKAFVTVPARADGRAQGGQAARPGPGSQALRPAESYLQPPPRARRVARARPGWGSTATRSQAADRRRTPTCRDAQHMRPGLADEHHELKASVTALDGRPADYDRRAQAGSAWLGSAASWKPPRAIRDRIASRSVRLVVPGEGDLPIRFAFADSSPSRPRAPRRAGSRTLAADAAHLDRLRLDRHRPLA